MESTPTESVDYGKSTLFRFLNIKDVALNTSQPTGTKGTIVLTRGGTMGFTGETESERFTKLDDVKTFNPELYNFAGWLAANKKSFSPKDAKAARTTAVTLNEDDENTVSDNVYYQLSRGFNKPLTDVLVNVIRANEFLKAFDLLDTAVQDADSFSSDQEYEDFKQISNAVISVPASDFRPGMRVDKQPVSLLSPEQKAALKKKQLVALATYRKSYFTSIANRYTAIEKKYSKERSDAYNTSYTDYQKTVNDLWDDYNASVGASPEETVALPTIPEFSFSFPAFDLDYIAADECYANLATSINDIKTGSFCGNLDKLVSFCNSKVEEAEKLYHDNILDTTNKTVGYEGFSIHINDNPIDNSYVLQLIRLLPHHSKYSLLISHYSLNANSSAARLTATITLADDSVLNDATDVTKAIRTGLYTGLVAFENSIDVTYDAELDLTLRIISEEGERLVQITTTITPELYLYGPAPAKLPETTEESFLAASSTDGELGGEFHSVYGIRKIGIGEYMRVDQEVCCYVPGEVSHIENIMAREYREKMARNLTREEATTEESEDSENESTKDVSSTDRNEMHREIAQMMSKEQSQQIGVNAAMNAGYSGGGYTVGMAVGTNLNFSNSASNSQNFNVAESFAHEITQKASERILKKVSYKRISKMLKEYEETNKHGFDNRNGSNHVVGIYRWVDKIYKNTLFNYGKRLMYEIMVPEPSKNFKQWVATQQTTSKTAPVAPVHPKTFAADIGVGFVATDVTETNFSLIAGLYGADVKNYPAPHINVGKAITEVPNLEINKGVEENAPSPNHYWHNAFKYEIEIPEGYAATKASYNILTRQFKWVATCDMGIAIGDRGWGYPGDRAEDRDFVFDNGFEKVLPIGVWTNNMAEFNLNVLAKCDRKDAFYEKWRNETYLAIMEAYNKKYQAYLDAKANYDNEQAATVVAIDYNYNPGKGRALEQREIKRSCIDMMFGTSIWGYIYRYFRDHMFNNVGGYYMPNFQSGLDLYSWYVRFFEQAFEWTIMSYEFSPYFYGEQNSWKDLINQKSTSDPLFEAFLQSGMAKVTLTVRPEYEKQVLYFFDTGMVPMSNDFMSTTAKDLYTTIMAELDVKTDAQQIAANTVKTWETRVPTDLVILQSSAAPLLQHGLPCACPNGLATGGLNMDESHTLGVYSNSNTELVGAISDAVKSVIDEIGKVIRNFKTEFPDQPEVDCSTYINQLATLHGNYQNLVDTFDASTDKPSICAATVTSLQGLVSDLKELMINALMAGCSTANMQTELTTIKASLTTIQAVCAG